MEQQPVGRVEDEDPGERAESRGEGGRGDHAVQSGRRTAEKDRAVNDDLRKVRT